MKLQKLIHSKDDLIGTDEDIIIVHAVNEIELGGEFTVCGRAIPDSVLSIEGWEAVGNSFKGNIAKCECKSCLRIIHYFKHLK